MAGMLRWRLPPVVVPAPWQVPDSGDSGADSEGCRFAAFFACNDRKRAADSLFSLHAMIDNFDTLFGTLFETENRPPTVQTFANVFAYRQH
jgi:hypothetical protein